jgi:myo-inositol-1(or 4)-monophosphatase
MGVGKSRMSDELSGDDLRRFRVLAEHLGREAGAILLSWYGKTTAREKAPFDLVTEADLASQSRVASLLAEAAPDHTLMAEEEGARPDPQRRFRWIVDPLDGTINYAHGVPLWCVSVALEHAGELEVGVIYEPLHDTLFSAARGQGATCNGAALKVSEIDRLEESLIATGLPTDFDSDSARQLAWFKRFSTGTHSVRRTGTSAWNLAMLAKGAFDVVYASDMNPWDAAAGVLLTREAGGVVTALDRRPYSLYGGGLLASNGRVHESALRAIRESAPSSRPA